MRSISDIFTKYEVCAIILWPGVYTDDTYATKLESDPILGSIS